MLLNYSDTVHVGREGQMVLLQLEMITITCS